MPRRIVNPASLARPSGFNHGILTSGGQLLFLAGQDASGPDGRIVAPGDLVGQCAQVLGNLRAVVEAAGGTMRDIVKLNVYVTDRDDYRANLKPLILEGERKLETKKEEKDYFRTERRYGAFHREIPLPEGAKAQRCAGCRFSCS